VHEVTFGIGPHWGDYAGSAEGVGRLAARIEGLGFDALFVGDHLSFHSAYPDPFVILSIAAARTQRIRLQTSVLILPLHQPFRLAHVAATLDAASGGRLILGVGVGGEGPTDFAAVEVPMEERGARADEILQILRRLWTETGEVTFAGKYYRLERVRLMVRPAQRPYPPLWVGGRSRAAIRRAATYGDAWIGIWVSAKRFREEAAALAATAQAAGRPPGSVTLALQVWGSLADSREQARAQVAAIMEPSYNLSLAAFERYLFLGREEDWAEQIREYAAAGVNRFNLVLCGPDFDEQLERAARAARLVRGA
jgi:probable F420-dependent oxidoreductase